MALFLHTSLTLSLTLCVLLHEALSLPLSGQSDASPPLEPRRVRTKRCSCSNWLDKECIYFCHLDIIWVNTPSKVTPYGLGSPLSRRRRSSARCECANSADATCSGFCQHSSEDAGQVVVFPSDQPPERRARNSTHLLTSIRQAVKANLKAAQQAASRREKSPRRLNRPSAS